MATFRANFAVDSYTLHLNFYDSWFYADEFHDDIGYTFGGRTYRDVYMVNGYDGATDLVLSLGGTGFSFDSLGYLNRGTITGMMESVYDGPELWQLQDVAVPAVQLSRAATTFGNADDRALSAVMLAGHDLFNLSRFDDRMEGWGGNDRMFGQAGNDFLIGGAGHDLLAGGLGNDRLVGGTGNDRLIATLGADRLEGAAGADLLEGGAGRDTMFAGADVNRDVFVFRTLADSRPGAVRDLIWQFRQGQDDIDLSLIDAHAGRAGNQAFTFSGTLAAAHSVWTVKIGDDLLVRADVNGNRLADLEIFVDDVARLATVDFIL